MHLSNSVPLCIDLDGTLLRSDLLLETGMAFVRSQPLRLFRPFSWLAKGKAALKEGLASATHIDVSVLPYDQAVIELIEAERSSGRTVVLATASHHTLAERIAEHLQLFDRVLASDTERNLSAHRNAICWSSIMVKAVSTMPVTPMTTCPCGLRPGRPMWSIPSPV